MSEPTLEQTKKQTNKLSLYVYAVQTVFSYLILYASKNVTVAMLPFFCFIFTLPDWLSTKTIDGGKGMSFLSQICRESSDNPLSYLPFLCCLHFLCCMSRAGA